MPWLSHDAMLQTQVDTIECPCVSGRCPRPCSEGAPIKELPSRPKTTEGDESADGREDIRNAFCRQEGGDGDSGGGGGGGGGDGDGEESDDGDGDGDFSIGTPDGRGRTFAHPHGYGEFFDADRA